MVLKSDLKIHMHLQSLDSTAVLLFTSLKVCLFYMILNLRPTESTFKPRVKHVLNKYQTAEDKVSCSRTQHNVSGKARTRDLSSSSVTHSTGVPLRSSFIETFYKHMFFFLFWIVSIAEQAGQWVPAYCVLVFHFFRFFI